MQDSKRDTDVKNRLLDYVGDGKGGMMWENGIETCILPYIKQNDQCSFHAWSRALKAGALGQLGGMGREGCRRGVGMVEHMYTHGWFMSMCGKNHHDIVK